MTQHSERLVVITGASSGIGRATAHLLASQGARLVLASRSAETLEEVRLECLGRGARSAVAMPTDVADRDAVTALFEAARRLGRVDAAVHTASVLAYGSFEDIPAEVFDRILATNLTGTANVARAALEAARLDGPCSLVVVGSVLGKIAAPYMSPYAASKWAVHGLVRTLQIEARERSNLAITLVAPGGVDTPIYDQAGSYTGHPAQPPPPVDPPEKVARAIVAALDRPAREVQVGLANLVMVAGFRLLPGVFDRIVGPLMRLLGQGRGSLGEQVGNVFEPVAEKNAVHGRWPHIWG